MLEPNAMLGPYRIAGILGEGGMGTVYRAKDTRLGRDVAIKVLSNVAFDDKERLVRFEQEARATGMLNHPNLLTIFDVGTADGTPYLVSELLEGATLRGRLARGPLSVRRAIDAALQMAQGLAAAHEKGVVHRDLKPDNIFLTRDGRLKILDFGIAKLTAKGTADGPTFEMAATEPGMVLGTVGYMSPEQVRGEPVDHRSDIFSMGAIVYEMLAGARAFQRKSSIETLSAILQDDPKELTEVLATVPPALDRLVRRCLEKDRDLRFQTARDLAFALETMASSTPAGASAAVTAQRHPPLPRAVRTSSPPPVSPTQKSPAVATTRLLSPPKKKRVSPVLLTLFFLVSVAGAAFGGWKLAMRMTAPTGEPQFQRMTFRRGDIRGARFTPDGETIVYSAAWDGAPSEVFVASRRAPEARPLGLGEADLLAVSRGELAVLLRRDRLTALGTLARVPLAGGMPREVAESVLRADWSPDGGSMAIIRVVAGKHRLEYPIGTVRYETVHALRDLRVSPDGTRVAFLEQLRGETSLAVVGSTGVPEPIAHGWAYGATGIAWTPEGKEIWITGSATSAPPALYAVKVDEGTSRLVSRLTGSMRLFDLSPQGHALLSNGTWRAAMIWSGAASTTDPVLQQAPERDVSWLDWSVLADLSPDGRTLLFNETREGGGTRRSVYLRRIEAPAPMRIGDGLGTALSPDGKWVLAQEGPKTMLLPTGTGEARELKLTGAFDNGAVFFPDSRRVVAGGVVGKEGYRLHVIDTLDETVKPVTPDGIWSDTPRAFAVSADGTSVAGMTKEGTIAVYPADGSLRGVPVPGSERGEIPIQWSADGSALYVHRPTGLPAQVWRIELATGTRTLWKELASADPSGVYKIAPVFVTPDGSTYAYNALRTLGDLYVAEGLR